MLKRTEEKIQGWIRDFYKDFISAHESRCHTNPEFKSCEYCGCLVYSKKAVKGVSFVRSIKKQQMSPVHLRPPWVLEIYTPYYCLLHAWIVKKKIDPKDMKSEYNHKFEKAIEELYSELIMEVSNKYPGESRHETALRYIREREERSSVGCSKEEFKHHETGREEDV